MELIIYQMWRLFTSSFVISIMINSVGSQTIDQLILQAYNINCQDSDRDHCTGVVARTDRCPARLCPRTCGVCGGYPDLFYDENTVLLELDMLIPRREYEGLTRERALRRKKRKAESRLGRRWTNREIPYSISGSFSSSDRSEIQAAVDEWNRYTCLNIRPYRSSDTNYVNVVDGNGCSSWIGMRGVGAQSLTLGTGCRHKRIAVHEFGHAAGFYHEQSRPDRDTYVTIDFSKVDLSQTHNFDKYTTINTYNVDYAYRSVMHYGQTAFGVNRGDVTITTTDPMYQTIIGNAPGLSFRDIKLANIMYNCADSCSPRTCPGEGYMAEDCKCYCQREPNDPNNPIEECQGGVVTCMDINPNCADLAICGECVRNRIWMLANCQRSCNSCGGTGPSITTPNPCQNNGVCSAQNRVVSCVCNSGWTGPRCATLGCTQSYCANGGRCGLVSDRPVCTCVDPWTGPRCMTSLCPPNYCANGGRCNVFSGRPVCTCVVPWTGPRCQTRGLCPPNYCANGGRCSVFSGRPVCTCVVPWTGLRCQTRDLCSPNPCQNNGVCSGFDGVVTCVCPVGWTGPRCTICHCPPNYCANGGWCSVTGASRGCICVPPWTGSRCQTNLCSPNPCQNNGACSTSNGAVSCVCQVGWTGAQCNIRSADLHQNCSAWAALGYCTHPLHQPFMLHSCPLACQLCLTTKSTITACVDRSQNCASWGRVGYCNNPTYAVFMRDNCPRTCRICSAPVCVNRNQFCTIWANTGHCFDPASRIYMEQFCRRACRLC